MHGDVGRAKPKRRRDEAKVTALLVLGSVVITVFFWIVMNWIGKTEDRATPVQGPIILEAEERRIRDEPGDSGAIGALPEERRLPSEFGAAPHEERLSFLIDAAVDIPQPRRVWAAVPSDAPKLAVVIDDWGYGWAAADRFLSFPAPLTVAVIPGLPFTQRQARQAREAGHDVILHLPMEPESDAWELLPGTITTDMSDEEIRESVRRSLAEIPWIIGVNNHMGSKATQDPRVMSTVLQTVYEAGYFFLDSRTTANSVIPALATDRAWEYLVNDRFIDNELQVERIRDRLVQAGRLAVAQGQAIAIGHVHPPTAEALYEALPTLQEMGVELVPLSAFVSESPMVEAFGMAARAEAAVQLGADAAEEVPRAEPQPESPGQPPSLPVRDEWADGAPALPF